MYKLRVRRSQVSEPECDVIEGMCALDARHPGACPAIVLSKDTTRVWTMVKGPRQFREADQKRFGHCGNEEIPKSQEPNRKCIFFLDPTNSDVDP